jgi:hypothetical protein
LITEFSFNSNHHLHPLPFPQIPIHHAGLLDCWQGGRGRRSPLDPGQPPGELPTPGGLDSQTWSRLFTTLRLCARKIVTMPC